MQGREHELQLAGDCLRDAARGRGRVLLIEGEPGIGKSAILAEVTALAAHRGFALAAAAADELGQLMPFAPLAAALPESSGALAGPAAGPAGASGVVTREFPAAGFGAIQALVERRTAAGPVLISLDDLHWADPATLTALRVLPRRLAAHPLAWVLARRTTAGGGGTGLLFDLLEKEGAARVTLGPLTGDAVAALLTDVLGGQPDQELAALAGGAAGHPYLLTELLRGLCETGAVRVDGQTAALLSAQLPERLHRVARRRLGELTGRTRSLLEIMAVLGDSFRLDDAADMLGEPAGRAAPAGQRGGDGRDPDCRRAGVPVPAGTAVAGGGRGGAGARAARAAPAVRRDPAGSR